MANDNKKFVVQKHTRGNDTHWDLMLEEGDILKTFRIDTPPQQISSGPVEAEKIFDHPLIFLTYEGPVNEGKGNVRIEDKGDYRIISKDDEQIKLQFHGGVLKGTFTLNRLKDQAWLLIPA